ncbi:MAG TPA: response regulator, partial [Steroidobacteraceae bacterium]
VLEGNGTVVSTAADLAAGLALLRAEPADLIILDLILPGVNGVDAIAELHREFPRARIVAISGGGAFGLDGYQPDSIATQAYLAAATAAGAAAVLAKPFELQQLRATMARVEQQTAP